MGRDRSVEVVHYVGAPGTIRARASLLEIAWELFLSLHAVRERLARVEAKLGVRTAADAIARALGESA